MGNPILNIGYKIANKGVTSSGRLTAEEVNAIVDAINSDSLKTGVVNIYPGYAEDRIYLVVEATVERESKRYIIDIPTATDVLAGLMSPQDKVKLAEHSDSILQLQKADKAFDKRIWQIENNGVSDDKLEDYLSKNGILTEEQIYNIKQIPTILYILRHSFIELTYNKTEYDDVEITNVVDPYSEPEKPEEPEKPDEPQLTDLVRVGNIQATRSGFSALLVEELMDASQDVEIGDASFEAQKSCFFILLDENGAQLSKCSYTSGGLTTDILNNDAWNVVHEDIEVNGRRYRIFAYRNGGVTPDDPQTYDFTTIKTQENAEQQ